jgi:hypothetical protein
VLNTTSHNILCRSDFSSKLGMDFAVCR